MNGFFVTGTDTGVGKTLVAAALLHRLAERGLRCAGMKPVAAGCVHTDAGWRNDDALQLLAHGNVALEYDEVNPYALPAACAPHLAAREVGVSLDVATLHRAYERLATRAEWVIVEGAGGWQVPLNDDETLADLAVRLQLPVILVVGLRLGCLNHALLTAEAIARRGARLAGWVANTVDPAMTKLAENIETLDRRLAAPRLARVPQLARAEVAAVAARLDLRALGIVA